MCLATARIYPHCQHLTSVVLLRTPTTHALSPWRHLRKKSTSTAVTRPCRRWNTTIGRLQTSPFRCSRSPRWVLWRISPQSSLRRVTRGVLRVRCRMYHSSVVPRLSSDLLSCGSHFSCHRFERMDKNCSVLPKYRRQLLFSSSI